MVGNRRIPTYRQAKVELRKVYTGRPSTLYCGCAYDPVNMSVEAGCGYAEGGRARVNWEHVVPASWLGRNRPAWSGDDPRCRKKRIRGRSCARLADPAFNRMEADLYNLFPSLISLNRARGSRAPGELDGEPRRFGRCDFEVKGSVVEPRPAVRGEMARTFLYMHAAYPDAGILRARLESTMKAWSKADPVTAPECERAKRIADVQGNENPFVAEPCRARGLYR